MIAILAKLTKDGQLKVGSFFKPDLVKLYGKEIEIKQVEQTRNNQQNKYLWGVVYRLASQHTGFEPEEVHQVFKERFLSYKKPISDMHGVKFYKFTRSTTELSVGEFADYVNKVKDYCSQELNLTIPDSDEI